MEKLVVVEVVGYDGEDGTIVVENYRAERLGMGHAHTIYCIGALERGGFVRISDWGYATVDEAREAIGFRRAAQKRSRRR